MSKTLFVCFYNISTYYVHHHHHHHHEEVRDIGQDEGGDVAAWSTRTTRTGTSTRITTEEPLHLNFNSNKIKNLKLKGKFERENGLTREKSRDWSGRSPPQTLTDHWIWGSNTTSRWGLSVCIDPVSLGSAHSIGELTSPRRPPSVTHTCGPVQNDTWI